MAQPYGGGTDTASTLVIGTFTATGQSAVVPLYASFNVSLWGTFGAVVQLERSFDGGTTWLPVAADTAGDVLKWSIPVSMTWQEVEHGTLYRLNCTSYSSGTVNYRISQSTDMYFVGAWSRT